MTQDLAFSTLIFLTVKVRNNNSHEFRFEFVRNSSRINVKFPYEFEYKLNFYINFHRYYVSFFPPGIRTKTVLSHHTNSYWNLILIQNEFRTKFLRIIFTWEGNNLLLAEFLSNVRRIGLENREKSGKIKKKS